MHPLAAAIRSLMLASVVLYAGAVAAQVPSDYVPPELRGVGVQERLGEMVPLDVPFKDERGRDVTLRDYLKPGRPIILTPVYYTCPQLCNLTLNALVNGLNELELSAGKDFEIISFSIKPEEGPELAEVKKRAYLTQYRREGAAEGWHFLTGSQQSIRQVCEAIGFNFRPTDDGEIAHTATIVYLTPDGRISRYMNDLIFEPRDLRLALIESSQGTIGSPMEHFLLLMCYQYDPDSNSYAASAVKIMRLGGAMTALLMLAGFGILWWRGSHTRLSAEVARDAVAAGGDQEQPKHPVSGSEA